jgi:hypothetical protein
MMHVQPPAILQRAVGAAFCNAIRLHVHRLSSVAEPPHQAGERETTEDDNHQIIHDPPPLIQFRCRELSPPRANTFDVSQDKFQSMQGSFAQPE